MTITLLQQDIAWMDTAANLKAAEEAILAAQRSDLYVLPEMFSTGFVTQPTTSTLDGTDATREGTALHWMQSMADRLDAAIAGSVATEEDGKYYNRFYFVRPTASGQPLVWYDKRHLFTYGGEHLRYEAGSERVEVEWRGVRFLLLVCYDLRFPVWSRNHADRPYDCALYVASWPTPRLSAWQTLLLARAIENQCYVCGVNRIGTDPACQYSGGTAFIDPYGKTIAESPLGEASAITATIDMERLQAFRKKFPVLSDAD